MPATPSQTPPQPDLKQEEARPSEAELAHAPEDGLPVRDPRREDVQLRDGRPSNDLGQEARVGERLGERGGRLGG